MKRRLLLIPLMMIFCITMTSLALTDHIQAKGEMPDINRDSRMTVDSIREAQRRYEKLLNLYRQGCDEGWNGNDFISHDLCYIFGYCPSEMKYCFYDLNSDGIPELFTGMEDAREDLLKFGYFYEIYTLADDEPVKIAEGTERCRYSICEDGSVCYFWTGGAAVNGWDYYTLPARAAAMTDTFRVAIDENYYDPGDGSFLNTVPPYDYSSNKKISAEMVEKITDGYSYIMPNFMLITDYHPVAE